MLNATLISRREITPDLLIIGVKPDQGVPSFRPGQYLALGIPEVEGGEKGVPGAEKVPLVKRAYSIGSSPTEQTALEFYIAVVQEGKFTPRLAKMKVGERLHAAPKVVGTFTLDGVPGDENLILVATGTGIAPYISMLRTPETWTEGRAITLIHGVRYPADLAYREELIELERSRPSFHYLPVVSRGDRDWSGLRGHVQMLFSPEGLQGQCVELNPERDHVYLCGNPAMVDDTEKLLLDRGYTVHTRRTPGRLHFEKYW